MIDQFARRGAALKLVFVLAVILALTALLMRTQGIAGKDSQVSPTGPQEAVSPADSNASTQPHTQPASGRLRIATYNVNFGLTEARLLDQVVENIKSAAADVVAIQEGNNHLAAHLKRHLAGVYPHMHFYPGPAAGGFAWLSKVPLSGLKVLPKSFGWFSTPTAELSWNGTKLHLVNVHLIATVPAGADGIGDIMRLFSHTEAIRRQEIEHIHSSLPHGAPVIMLGDFNTMPGSCALAFLAAKGLVDSFASIAQEGLDGHTWKGLRNGLNWRFRFDYIWHSQDIRTHGSTVVRNGPSDHYLVLSELEVSGQASSRPAVAATTE